jgi:hypothetical protein
VALLAVIAAPALASATTQPRSAAEHRTRRVSRPEPRGTDLHGAPACGQDHVGEVSRAHVKIAFASAGGRGRVAFVCRIDGKPAHRCASPIQLRLTPGTHRFSVSAVGGGAERSALASTSIGVG